MEFFLPRIITDSYGFSRIFDLIYFVAVRRGHGCCMWGMYPALADRAVLCRPCRAEGFQPEVLVGGSCWWFLLEVPCPCGQGCCMSPLQDYRVLGFRQGLVFTVGGRRIQFALTGCFFEVLVKPAFSGTFGKVGLKKMSTGKLFLLTFLACKV